MKVLITPEAIEYFNELSTILYEKDQQQPHDCTIFVTP